IFNPPKVNFSNFNEYFLSKIPKNKNIVINDNIRIERSDFTKSKFDMIFFINHHCEAGKKEKHPIKIIAIKIIPTSNNPLTISESL
ncbi:hypothetical protein OSB85_23400, partial [Enterobacter asburiae]|uniref:hypothetical protein n=1 Tax=Enterobacter asburiae TaxID=61645 RepID=UPI00234B503D